MAAYEIQRDAGGEGIIAGNPWFVHVYADLTGIFKQKQPQFAETPISPFEIEDQAWLNTLMSAVNVGLNGSNEAGEMYDRTCSYVTEPFGEPVIVNLAQKSGHFGETYSIQLESQTEGRRDYQLHETEHRITGLETAENGERSPINGDIARAVLQYVVLDGPKTVHAAAENMRQRLPRL